MTRTPLAITLAAVAALAGCNNSDHNIVSGQEPDDDTNVAANANVQLPPTIASSKIYRCEDNKVVYVDWLSDNKAPNVAADRAGAPTQALGAHPGKPMTGPAGYSIEGSAASGS